MTHFPYPPLAARAFVAALLLAALPALAAENVKLKLSGPAGFRFAGYYVAKELGFYADEGLSVTLEAGDGEADAVRAVATGKATFGIGTSRLLVARAEGTPVVALAVIFQQSEDRADFYGDTLFVAEPELKRRERVVEAFRDASLRGWRYVIESPQKAIDLVRARYATDQSRDALEREAGRVTALVRADLVEIGQMSPTRWRRIAEAFIEQRQLASSVSLEGFLHHPDSQANLGRVYAVLAIALALVLLAGGTVAYVQRTNARLRRALEESQQAHAARAASEERLRLLADHASDVIWTRDLAGRYTYVSPSVARVTGFTVEEALAQAADEGFSPSSAARMKEGVATLLARAAAGEPEPVFRAELEQRRADGSFVWVEATVTAMRGREGRLEGVVGVTRDISERKANEARIRELSLHDALTGLPNRTLFSDRLGLALAAAYREARRLAVMFIDLDRFKPVNDTHGHAVGDLLLREVANRMRACVRDSDTVARIGGDEFVVLLRNVEGSREARAVAEKIREAVDQPFDIGGTRLEISCCVGIALYPEHGKDELELSQKADAAMYWAKAHGRDAVQLHDPALASPLH